MIKFSYIFFLVTIAMQSIAQHVNVYVKGGNKLYKEGKFDKALPEYKKAIEVNAGDPVANYNMGNAFFRNSRYVEAATTFDNTITNGKGTAIKQKAFYNKGVSLSKQNKLQESIEAYKSAVKLDPSDEDARINLQKALLELEKTQPPKEQNKEDEKKKKDKKKDQQKQPPQSNLTKKQVEQLLKALQQREQQVQQKMQKNKNRTAGQQEKDW
jgi:tetratricopeptide (TPR) repeat protein